MPAVRAAPLAHAASATHTAPTLRTASAPRVRLLLSRCLHWPCSTPCAGSSHGAGAPPDTFGAPEPAACTARAASVVLGARPTTVGRPGIGYTTRRQVERTRPARAGSRIASHAQATLRRTWRPETTSPSRSGPPACHSRGCPGLTVVGHTAQPRNISKVGSAYYAYKFHACIFCIFFAYFGIYMQLR